MPLPPPAGAVKGKWATETGAGARFPSQPTAKGHEPVMTGGGLHASIPAHPRYEPSLLSQ